MKDEKEAGEPIRIFVVAGSSRRVTYCPEVDRKAKFFVERAKEKES